MDRGTYVAASGGLLQFSKLDIVNNNLANVGTPGFKRQALISSERSFNDTLARQLAADDPFAAGDQERTPEVVTVGSYTDFSMGAVRETGNPLDAALSNPNDFFAVATPEGLQYTRAGNFTLNAEGTLVTQDGLEVQGDGGALTASGAGARVTSNGSLMVGNEESGRLQVVRFTDPSVLERAGGSRFKLPAGAQAGQTVDAELIPQSLEMSNVSAITSMIDLVSTNRAFEMYEKTAKTIDELNSAAIQQIGRRNG